MSKEAATIVSMRGVGEKVASGNGASADSRADMRDPGSQVTDMCRVMLEAIGEDPQREGLRKTPERFSRAMAELTSGYEQSVETLVNDAIFEEKCSEMILVRDVEFFSLCEHHLLPFFGSAHVAYIPNGKILGLSKIPRLVNMFARRLQVQERLTEQVANCLDDLLQPLGVACMIEASHMCMRMRGVQSRTGVMVTNAMRGIFMSDARTREEFLNLARNHR